MAKRVYHRSMDGGVRGFRTRCNARFVRGPSANDRGSDSGMSLSQRFTLDHPSFEKFLAAAWVLQCVHDQLHSREVDPDETIAELAKPQKAVETGNSGLQAATKPVVHFPSVVTGADGERDVLDCRSAGDETLAELVEAQQAIETGTLDLDAAMKRVLVLSLRFTKAEGAAVWLFAQDEFVYRAGAGTASNNEKLRLAVLSSLAGAWPGNGKEVHRVNEATPSMRSWVADLGAGATSLLVAPIYHGREVAGALTAFANPPNSFSDHHRTTVRLMSGLLSHALRKAAEVELRAVEPETVELKQNGHTDDTTALQVSQPSVPVLKKLADDDEQSRRRPSSNLRIIFNRVRDVFSNLRPRFHIKLTVRALRTVVIAHPVFLLAIVAALLLLETLRHEPFRSALAISTRSASGDTSKRTDNTEPQRPRPIPPLEVSHMQATDPATSLVVQELSRYEIRGLRRQAQFGDDSAAFTLGMAFETGRHLRQSCSEAARWVAIAAEAGNAAAQYNLGLRYRDGDGVPANRAESEKWLRKASAGKNPKAQRALKMLASR
jgi:GAF domain/Sel1 repeat